MKTIFMVGILCSTMAMAQQSGQAALGSVSKGIQNGKMNVGNTANLPKQTTNSQQQAQPNAAKKAGRGSEGVGGGNAVGDQLLDFAEAEAVELIDPTKLKVYREKVVPILKSVKAKVPGFAIDLENVATKKLWLASKVPLSGDLCVDSTMLSFKTKVVACQTEDTVYLDKDWFFNADPLNQEGLLVHEMVRGVQIRNLKNDLVSVEPKAWCYSAQGFREKCAGEPDGVDPKLANFVDVGIRQMTRALVVYSDQMTTDDLVYFMKKYLGLYMTAGSEHGGYATAEYVNDLNEGVRLYNQKVENFGQLYAVYLSRLNHTLDSQCGMSAADEKAMSAEGLKIWDLSQHLGEGYFHTPLDIQEIYHDVVADVKQKKAEGKTCQDIKKDIKDRIDWLNGPQFKENCFAKKVDR